MVYGRFAIIYDALMKHAPYDKWVTFTTNIIEQFNVPVKTIIDLGCGTGELTIRLGKLGYEMIGIDQSNDMLTVAAEKAYNQQIDINWIQQDIRELTGFKDVDLFISYCDVINYITNLDDVKKVFEQVYNCLKPGGLFIFDFHSINYTEHHLCDRTFADVTDELTYIWECERGDKEGEMFHYMTFFQKENDRYVRFDEVHHQKTYPLIRYKNLLESCQFKKINFYADFMFKDHFSEQKSERIFGVAQK